MVGVTGGFLEFASNPECRSAGVLSSCGRREWPAPESQCGVALEIAGDSAEAVNLGGDHAEDSADAVQECDEVVRRSFSVSREISEVTEHDCDIAFARFEQRGVGVVAESCEYGRCKELPET